ncbi:putative esterase YitV isoform X2 [Vigna umbellata]|uniref:putative esterase YitV isoform X2 n=1 Tax=Vigna umbellata TaxID=87088 RepID=UPI001F5EB5F9|nr:putative esterase YitV isoform X2 [Vigna umbellata]
MLIINFKIQSLQPNCQSLVIIRTVSQTHSQPKSQTKMAEKEAIEEAHSKLRFKLLREIRWSNRRECEFPPKVRHYRKVVSPYYENSPPTKEEMEIMESCPKVDRENLEELLQEENFYLVMNWNRGSESGDEEEFADAPDFVEIRSRRRIPWVPVLIYKPKESDNHKKRPAVVFLHDMNKNKEFFRPLLKAYASRGYITVAVDACYHGERATYTHAYRDALTYAWSSVDTSPFIYEPVCDLMRLADYLTEREDIDPSRIGITGISLGGIHAWFAAVADTRYSVVVPLIAVRGFQWAIDNDKWKGQVDSMEILFEVGRHNLCKDRMDKEVVEKVSRVCLQSIPISLCFDLLVFDHVSPCLTSEFDAPYSIPAIAPRPLLIINGAEDPQCPVAGLEVTRSKAIQAYQAFQCVDNFKFIAEAGVGHQLTRLQVKESADWFDRFLKP